MKIINFSLKFIMPLLNLEVRLKNEEYILNLELEDSAKKFNRKISFETQCLFYFVLLLQWIIRNYFLCFGSLVILSEILVSK